MERTNMDKFRKQQGMRPRNSVDGIIVGSSHGRRAGTNSTSRPQIGGEINKNNVGSLGKFDINDGFHSTKQPHITENHPLNKSSHISMLDEATGKLDLSLSPSPRSKFSRFKRRKKQRTKKQKIMRGVIGSLLFILMIGGFLFGKGYLKLGNILKGGSDGAPALQDNVDPTRLNGEGDGRVNILVLGKGGEGHTAPNLTDTILVVSIDPVQKKAAILSIPRDLCIKSPCSSSFHKINSVYSSAKTTALDEKKSDQDAENAGLSAIKAIVSEKMGIPIHYQAMVDFSGFKQAVDAVGGIDINVAEENTVYEVLWDPTTRKHYTLDVKKGQQHFDGTRALFYSRSRQTSTRGDFDRTERQRLVMIALKEKILSLGTFANPVKVSQLIDAFGDRIQANLTISEVMRIYEIGKDINSSDIASVGLADPPNNYVKTATLNGISFVVPTAGTTNFSEIQNYVRNELRDSYLTKEDAIVAVYNGTTIPGLASKKSIELKSFGYTIGTVANAPTTNYPKTIIVDLTKGQKNYTRNYLEKRFGVTAVSKIPDGNIPAGTNDFVIIIGQDNSGQ